MQARSLKSRDKSRAQVDQNNVRSVTDIDRVIGMNMLLIRSAKDMSQGQLAEELGVSFQQIQKYEGGKNRISASRLYQAALALDVSLLDFFRELPLSRRSFADEFLTKENVEILTLIGSLPKGEKQEIAKKIIRVLAN